MNWTSGIGGSVLVIDPDRTSAETLSGMIEFLDTPNVTIVDDQSWPDAVSRELEIVFLGRGLSQESAHDIETWLQAEQPGVAIVHIRDSNGSGS
ncbi:MAG: hypothetical protein AAFQ99_07260 [Pseudomonadota bacterium]